MRKALTTFAAIMLMGGMCATANAGQLVGAFTAGDDAAQLPTVYAQEMVNANLSTQVPGNAVVLELTGTDTLPAAATNGYKLIYTLPAGTTWASPNANYQLAESSAAGALATTGTLTAGGVGSNRLEMSVNTGAGAWALLEDIQLTNVAPGGLRINNATLATSGASITLQVELRDAGNTLLSSASLDFMKSVYGFEMVTNAAQGGNAVILDCPSGRTKFLIGGQTLTDLTNAVWVTINPTIIANTVQGNGATAFALGAGDSYNLRLLGDFTGITRVWLDFDNDSVEDNGEIPTITGAAPTQTATWSGVTAATWATGQARPLNMRVNGSSTLENRTFTLEGDLNLVDGSFNDHANLPIMRVATAVAAGVVTAGSPEKNVYVWNHNCYEAVTPYMNQSAAFNTFIKLYNRSNLTANVIVDITPDNGVGGKTAYALTGSIAPNSVGFYKAADIAAAAGVTAESYGMRLIVTAPANSVYGVVVQKSAAGGDRVIPLYSNGNDY